MNKAILKLEVRDEEQKKEVLDTVSGFSGVDSFSMDMEEKKLTVIGDFDPVNIVSKLTKLCHTEIVSVVPVYEAEEKEDGQKLLTVLYGGGFKYDSSYNPRFKVADDNTYAHLSSNGSAYPHMPTYVSPRKTAKSSACVIL